MLETSGRSMIAPTREELLRHGAGEVVLGVRNLIVQYAPRVVINCIGETDWRICEQKRNEAELSNVRIPEAVSMTLNRTSHFVHISSDAVFGGGLPPYSPSDPRCPVSTYGSQKAEAERIVLGLAQDNVSILRGAFFGYPDAERTNFFKFLIQAFSRGKSVEGYCDFVNNPVSVHTFARLIARVVDFGPIGLGHFGTERGYSKWEFATLVANSMKYPEDLVVKVTSPESSVASGGLNLTLESESSWSKLGYRTPEMLAEIISAREEFERWNSLGN